MSDFSNTVSMNHPFDPLRVTLFCDVLVNPARALNHLGVLFDLLFGHRESDARCLAGGFGFLDGPKGIPLKGKIRQLSQKGLFPPTRRGLGSPETMGLHEFAASSTGRKPSGV